MKRSIIPMMLCAMAFAAGAQVLTIPTEECSTTMVEHLTAELCEDTLVIKGTYNTREGYAHSLSCYMSNDTVFMIKNDEGSSVETSPYAVSCAVEARVPGCPGDEYKVVLCHEEYLSRWYLSANTLVRRGFKSETYPDVAGVEVMDIEQQILYFALEEDTLHITGLLFDENCGTHTLGYRKEGDRIELFRHTGGEVCDSKGMHTVDYKIPGCSGDGYTVNIEACRFDMQSETAVETYVRRAEAPVSEVIPYEVTGAWLPQRLTFTLEGDTLHMQGDMRSRNGVQHYLTWQIDNDTVTIVRHDEGSSLYVDDGYYMTSRVDVKLGGFPGDSYFVRLGYPGWECAVNAPEVITRVDRNSRSYCFNIPNMIDFYPGEQMFKLYNGELTVKGPFKLPCNYVQDMICEIKGDTVYITSHDASAEDMCNNTYNVSICIPGIEGDSCHLVIDASPEVEGSRVDTILYADSYANTYEPGKEWLFCEIGTTDTLRIATAEENGKTIFTPGGLTAFPWIEEQGGKVLLAGDPAVYGSWSNAVKEAFARRATMQGDKLVMFDYGLQWGDTLYLYQTDTCELLPDRNRYVFTGEMLVVKDNGEGKGKSGQGRIVFSFDSYTFERVLEEFLPSGNVAETFTPLRHNYNIWIEAVGYLNYGLSNLHCAFDKGVNIYREYTDDCNALSNVPNTLLSEERMVVCRDGDCLMATFPATGEGAEIVLYDITGRVVSAVPLRAGVITAMLPVGSLPHGAYIVALTSAGKRPLTARTVL